MSKLSSKQRKKLPKSDFAVPGKRAYPVNDKAHARNALARASQYATPSVKKAVKAKVAKKFPGIAVSGKAAKNKAKGKK